MAISIKPCLHCWKEDCSKKKNLIENLNSIKEPLKDDQIFITTVKLKCKESGSPFIGGNIVYDKIHKKYAIVLEVKFHKVHVKYDEPYTSHNGKKYTESWLNFDAIDIEKGIDLSEEYRPKPRYKGDQKQIKKKPNKLDKTIERLKGLYGIWHDQGWGSPAFDYENHMKSIDPTFDYKAYCRASGSMEIEEED